MNNPLLLVGFAGVVLFAFLLVIVGFRSPEAKDPLQSRLAEFGTRDKRGNWTPYRRLAIAPFWEGRFGQMGRFLIDYIWPWNAFGSATTRSALRSPCPRCCIERPAGVCRSRKAPMVRPWSRK